MKKLVLILTVLLMVISCKKEKTIIKTTIEKTTINFDFLVNKWIRTNDKEGSVTYENWQKIDDSLYKGLGCTLNGKDTVFKENMELLKVNNQWNLKVIGVHEKPIFFKLTSFSDTNFIAENPKNEFPKIIKYQLEKDNLFAEVIADSIKIGFKFKKYELKNTNEFTSFFNKFSQDSIFQYKSVKFPLKSTIQDYSDTLQIEFLKSTDWEYIDFSKDKDAINNKYDKFEQVFEHIDTLNIIYKRRGIDNGIMMNYYFKKISNHWFLISTEDFST